MHVKGLLSRASEDTGSKVLPEHQSYREHSSPRNRAIIIAHYGGRAPISMHAKFWIQVLQSGVELPLLRDTVCGAEHTSERINSS